MSSLPRTRTSYMAHRDGQEPDADDPLLFFKPARHVVRESIDKFLEGMRDRRLANEKLMAELDTADAAQSAGNDLDAPLVDEGSKSERDMTDRPEKRGEQRVDERDPKLEREPQEQARRNNAQSVDKEGRDANRDGSESDT